MTAYDIVVRPMKWSISTHAVPASDIMDEAADEIERLRGTQHRVSTGRTGNQWFTIPEPLVPYEKNDENRGDSHAIRGTNKPRNGALSGCETVPDPDSRTWETCTSQRQPTLTDTELEALSWFTGGRGPVCPQHLATIRNLMARLS